MPGLTAAAMAELQKLQKMKMMMSLQNGNESDNDDLHSNTGVTPGQQCSFKQQQHFRSLNQSGAVVKHVKHLKVSNKPDPLPGRLEQKSTLNRFSPGYTTKRKDGGRGEE